MNFIKSWSVDQKCINDIPALNGFDEATWLFISSIYESSWDSLYANNKGTTFRQEVLSKFTPKNNRVKPTSNSQKLKEKQAEIVKLPPPILARLLKEVLEKSKFF